MSPRSIAADHARRFLVRRHLLAPPRALPARPSSVLDVVARLGSLQFDPLEVPGARNHDLVLHARIGGYERAWCEAFLYGADRRLIELYNKSLNILPIDELPHYAVAWERSAAWHEDRILTEQADVVAAILARLEAEGPLTTAAFAADHGHTIDWSWAPTRASRAVMEALFVVGRIGVARRDGNRRFYDLIDRLVPAELLARRESTEDGMTHRLLSRYRATGMTTSIGTQSEVMYSAGSQAERIARTARLVDEGRLLPIEVDGLKRVQYVIADEEWILDETEPPDSIGEAEVSFLAPLDPLVWDRKMLRALWDFDYLWEVYVPEAKRRWGYYVLPMLWGDRFVGRIEPRFDRRARTLAMTGVWFQPDFDPTVAPAFLPALARAVEAYAAFVGAAKVSWPRTKAGRAIAGRLRRVA